MSANPKSTTVSHLASTSQAHGRRGVGSPAAPVVRFGRQMAGTRAGHFVRHSLEMCAAMCVGMVALDPVYKWAAGQFGIGDPYLQLPELTALVLAFNMTVPMVAWMRFRGMDWRSNAEMSAAMVIEAVLIIAAFRLGFVTNFSVNGSSNLYLLQHGLMMPAMLIPMLLRLDVYTGKHCHGTN